MSEKVNIIEEFKRKKAQAIGEKVIVAGEIAALTLGTFAGMTISLVGASKIMDKIAEGYDEDNPMGVVRSAATIGVIIAGATGFAAAGSIGTDLIADKIVEFEEIEIPKNPEDVEIKEIINEMKNEKKFDPDVRITL